MFQDGFGQRSFAVDQESGDQVEVLTFAPELNASPGFGQAVGERVAKLVRVRHAMYARVRRIDRPSRDSLLLFSDRVHGWRLADVLRMMERERMTLDVSAVLALLRQLIPAAALFSRHQRDAAIGTIGPERLILTPQGRLVLAEYVMAPGLERLQYSRERLWRDLRVAVPPTSSPMRMPPGADVVGIGVVALSLVTGRVLKDDEYLFGLEQLLESATESEAGETRKLSAGFAGWLGRALQSDEHTALRSPQEAQISFEEMLAKERRYITSTAQLDLFIEQCEQLMGSVAAAPPSTAGGSGVRTVASATTASATMASITLPGVTNPAFTIAAGPAATAVANAGVPGARFATDSADASSEETFPTVAAVPAAPAPAAVAFAPATPSFSAPESSPVSAAVPVPPVTPRWLRPAGAAAAAVILLQAGAIAWLMSGAGPAGTNEGELVVQSRPVAARVVIDGEERGSTPFTTQLAAGSHVLEIRVGRSEPRVIPVEIREGMQSGIYVELQSVATVGGLEVRSAPAQAKVTVAGQYRGTTPLVVKDLPPGDIEVLLQSGARQVRQTVRIEPGITSQLVVPLDR